MEMRKACRLGQAVPSEAVENEFNSGGEIHLVPDGDVEGGRALLRAENHADLLMTIEERHCGVGFGCWFGVFTDEPALRYPDCWAIQEEPQMAGNPEASWMGETMAIDEHHIGLCWELREELEVHRRLPEGEEARDVGERGLCLRFCSFEDFHRLYITDNDPGGEQWTLLDATQIKRCHRSDVFEMECWPALYPRSEHALDPPRLVRGDSPRMELIDVHQRVG
jgi:hypothetical protein